MMQAALAVEVNMACIWHGMAIAIRVRVDCLRLIDTLRGRYYKTSLSAELITYYATLMLILCVCSRRHMS
jgi:hypothetical protein